LPPRVQVAPAGAGVVQAAPAGAGVVKVYVIIVIIIIIVILISSNTNNGQGFRLPPRVQVAPAGPRHVQVMSKYVQVCPSMSKYV